MNKKVEEKERVILNPRKLFNEKSSLERLFEKFIEHFFDVTFIIENKKRKKLKK